MMHHFFMSLKKFDILVSLPTLVTWRFLEFMDRINVLGEFVLDLYDLSTMGTRNIFYIAMNLPFVSP